jgi:hypothetical protein
MNQQLDDPGISPRQRRERALAARHDHEMADLAATEEVAAAIAEALTASPPDIGDCEIRIGVGGGHGMILLRIDRHGVHESGGASESECPF